MQVGHKRYLPFVIWMIDTFSNMTGIRWFLKNLCFLVLQAKVASALERLIIHLHIFSFNITLSCVILLLDHVSTTRMNGLKSYVMILCCPLVDEIFTSTSCSYSVEILL